MNNETPPIDTTVEYKILQARLDEITRYEKRESRAVAVLQGSLVGIVAIILVVQYFNYDTVMNFISSAETNLDRSLATADDKLKNALKEVDVRLASALNDTEPDRAMLEPLYLDFDANTLVYDARIQTWDDNSQRYYSVLLVTRFYTSIEGPPGRMTGLMIKYSGPGSSM